MQKLIFDAGPLITSCKYQVEGRLVIDHVLDHAEIVVAESVRSEVVVAGARYADAQAARRRLDRGQIGVLCPPSEPALEKLLAPYELGDGERDSILLAQRPDMQDGILVIDDHLAYLVSDRLQRRQRFLLDVIADMARGQMFDHEVASQLVRAIQSRYPPAFVEHTLLLLER